MGRISLALNIGDIVQAKVKVPLIKGKGLIFSLFKVDKTGRLRLISFKIVNKK